MLSQESLRERPSIFSGSEFPKDNYAPGGDPSNWIDQVGHISRFTKNTMSLFYDEFYNEFYVQVLNMFCICRSAFIA